MTKLALLTCVVLLGAPMASFAHEEGEQKNHPCKADHEKFCKDVKPGDGRIIACMKEHAAELSPECKAKMAEKWQEMAKDEPCRADREKFCKDVKPGEGRIIACMK